MAKKASPTKKLPLVLKAILACEGVSRSPDNKTTLYGIFDKLFISDLSETFSFHLFIKLGGEGVQKISVDLLDGGGKSALGKEKINFQPELQGGGLEANINLILAFKKEGVFKAVVSTGTKVLGEYPITVRKAVKVKQS